MSFPKENKEQFSKDDIPQEFLCPITREIMSDPHITLSGHTYEKYAIEQWLSSHSSDPLTNAQLINKILIPNHTLRKQIQSFIEKNNIKLRSNKSSPFKYLLRLLRIHANQLKSMHVSCNLLSRYGQLFATYHENNTNNLKSNYNTTYYQKIIQRYLKDWKMYSKAIEAKWIDILAKIIFIKEKIYKYHTLNFDSDDDSDEDEDNGDEEKFDIDDLFEKCIVKSLISIKTSLREIVGIQSNIKFILQYFFQHTDINAFVKVKKRRANNHDDDEKKLEIIDLDNNGEEEEGKNEDETSIGWFSEDFEDDLTAFSMIAGALIGGNACGSTGAVIGSAAGPVGTVFGAAIGFYIGAIAGSTPSMLYGIYVESEKMKQKEIDRLWKLIYFGLKKYNNWIDKEKNEFNVCDQIFVSCMQSIIYCLDHHDEDDNNDGNNEEDEIDFIYQSIDDELIEIWQYDISRIVPVLQECLAKVE